MKDPAKAPSMSDRWRRIVALDFDEGLLGEALAALPAMRNPRLRVRSGAVQAEMEGTMGALHEVSVQAPPLPARIWPQVVRALRRSSSMLGALKQGLVPRAFDRLIARIAGEPAFPEPRRISSACTCSEPDRPCRHILALHELFARSLDEKPWQLLVLRGVPLRELIEQAERAPHEGELMPLAFAAREEPVLFPEGADLDLESPLSPGEIRVLLGAFQSGKLDAVSVAIDRYAAGDDEEPDTAAGGSPAAGHGRA